MGVKRAHIGCGSHRPEGWDNFDHDHRVWSDQKATLWDVRKPMVNWGTEEPIVDEYDYAVCSFMLQELDFHELPGALQNIRAILKPGGVLRVLVPDILAVFAAFEAGDEAWFPQDERTGGLDAKFCTMLVWYGTVRSVFTRGYLAELLVAAGFGGLMWHSYGVTSSPHPEIVDLDSRPAEALIIEAVRQ